MDEPCSMSTRLARQDSRVCEGPGDEPCSKSTRGVPTSLAPCWAPPPLPSFPPPFPFPKCVWLLSGEEAWTSLAPCPRAQLAGTPLIARARGTSLAPCPPGGFQRALLHVGPPPLPAPFPGDLGKKKKKLGGQKNCEFSTTTTHLIHVLA